MNDDDRRRGLGRTSGPMGFAHDAGGLRPIGSDGWPMTVEEILELVFEEQGTLGALVGEAVIEVEADSVTDTELDTRHPKYAPPQLNQEKNK